MGFKVQFNPSTGKASITSADKVQVVSDVAPVDPCLLCASSPDQISVTLSGFSVECCAGTGGAAGKSRIWDTGMESVINDTFILDAISPCQWFKSLDIDVDLLDYDTGDCSGGSPATGHDTLQLLYSVTSNGTCSATLIISAINTGVSSKEVIRARLLDTDCEDVIDSECLPIDDLTLSSCNYATRIRLTGGTIVMVAV